MVGDGELKRQLVLTAKQNNIYERVHSLGFRKDISPLLGVMDIMLHPSRWEGFGIILAEAMYYGIPIVASDRGGIPEVIKNGVTGYLHSFGDNDSLKKEGKTTSLD